MAKKSGIVIEFPHTAEYFLRRLATKSQFRYVPVARPTIVQNTSQRPVRYASPGSPISK